MSSNSELTVRLIRRIIDVEADLHIIFSRRKYMLGISKI